MNKLRLMQVILAPLMSEKSTSMADAANQFAFKVIKDSTKPEIAAAVELLFNVKVEKVQVLNVKGKVKRYGKYTGRRIDWKKAYVRIQAGQDINFAENT